MDISPKYLMLEHSSLEKWYSLENKMMLEGEML